RSDRVMLQGQNLARLLVDMQTGLRGYVITGRPELLDNYDRGRRSVDSAMEQLGALVADDPEQRQRAEAIRPDLATWLEYAARAKGLAEGHALDPRLIADEGEPAMEALQAGLSGIAAAESSQREARLLSIRRATTITLGGGLALVV